MGRETDKPTVILLFQNIYINACVLLNACMFKQQVVAQVVQICLVAEQLQFAQGGSMK